MEKLNTDIKRQIIQKKLRIDHHRLIINTISFLCVSLAHRITNSSNLQTFDAVMAVFVFMLLIGICFDIRKDRKELKKLND